MVTINKTVNVNGISIVKDSEGKQAQVAYMNASINVDGAFNSNHSIQNKAVFEAHKEEVLEDFAAFDAYVYRLAEESNMQAELDVATGGAADAEAIQQN